MAEHDNTAVELLHHSRAQSLDQIMEMEDYIARQEDDLAHRRNTVSEMKAKVADIEEAIAVLTGEN